MARRLRPKQYEAALLIAKGEADYDIARFLKLRRNTLQRWRCVPEFGECVLRYRQEIQQAATNRIHALRLVSANELETNVRFRSDAAKMQRMLELLDYCNKIIDVKDES